MNPSAARRAKTGGIVLVVGLLAAIAFTIFGTSLFKSRETPPSTFVVEAPPEMTELKIEPLDVWELGGEFHGFVVGPDGRSEAWSQRGTYTQRWRNGTSPDLRQVLDNRANITALTAPEPRVVALILGSKVMICSKETRAIQETISYDRAMPLSLGAWAKDNSALMAIGFDTGDIDLVQMRWDFNTLFRDEMPHKLTPHAAAVQAMSMSPQGQRLVSGAADGTLFVHYLPTRIKTLELTLTNAPIKPKGITDVIYSANGERLAACAGDRVAVWDTVYHTRESEPATKGRTVTKLALSANGALLAGVSGNDVLLWRVWPRPERSVNEPVILKNAHKASAVQFAGWISEDELATCGADGAIRHWRISGLMRHAPATRPAP